MLLKSPFTGNLLVSFAGVSQILPAATNVLNPGSGSQQNSIGWPRIAAWPPRGFTSCSSVV